MTEIDGEPEAPATPSGIKTYSLEEVAAMHLPARWKNPTRWLADRLNRNELRGVKLGRADWRMRESDVEFMLTKYSNDDRVKKAIVADRQPDDPVIAGITERGLRRIRRPS